MSPHRANERAVFMGGAGRSGSTLLGLMLGAHPSIFYAGEAAKSLLLGDPSKPFNKRVCKLCGPGCAVWGDLQVASGEDLYETLARRTGSPIVVDSAKQLAWIEYQVAALRGVVPLHLIMLARDGRAVVNSWLRQFPETPAREHAAAWATQMRGSEELAARWPGSVHRVRYEELALRPEPTLRALADFLGIAFDPGMLERGAAISTRSAPTTGRCSSSHASARAASTQGWSSFSTPRGTGIPRTHGGSCSTCAGGGR